MNGFRPSQSVAHSLVASVYIRRAGGRGRGRGGRVSIVASLLAACVCDTPCLVLETAAFVASSNQYATMQVSIPQEEEEVEGGRGGEGNWFIHGSA